MERTRTRDRKPVIALTGGDPNGIGPEICLRAARSAAVRAVCRPVLVGDPAVFEYYRRKYRIGVTLAPPDPEHVTARGRMVQVFPVSRSRPFRASPGSRSRDAGLIAGRSLELGISLCRSAVAAALVTGPLSKSALNDAGFSYPGQTEMVARLSRSGPPLMLLVHEDFRVALVTTHLPLRRVAAQVTAMSVARTIGTFHDSLVRDFGRRRPSIAVLGLNPHAGEEGLLGEEERRSIIPAIRSARRKGMDVAGPFPADGFFGNRSQTAFDGVVAMYHDQGLIPLKLLGFPGAVNFTAGLSVVRTSPGHGTAYELAGKGIADPSGMIAAVVTAARIWRRRKVRPGGKGRK